MNALIDEKPIDELFLLKFEIKSLKCYAEKGKNEIQKGKIKYIPELKHESR